MEKPVHGSNVLNRHASNQGMSVVDSGTTLLISGGKTKKEKGIPVSHKETGIWSKPHQLNIDHFTDMNIGKYYGATMTNDMKVILHYFSEHKDSKKNDIYVSFQREHYHY